MKKLEKIWKNRKQIMEGVKNATCVVPGTQPCCNLCGCSLAFKTRSLSSECPDLRWHALLTEEEEDKLNAL